MTIVDVELTNADVQAGRQKRYGLVSVSDKKGILPFARGLADWVNLLSTGGTAKLLGDNGIPVTEVAKHTGFPEMLDGRVKTLHPKIHGGILARRDQSAHMNAIAAAGIAPIDVVAFNLYPFADTVAKPGCTLAEAIEQIDIGGPAALRAAAKNYTYVTVVVDPADYDRVLEEMSKNNGAVGEALRFELMKKVFVHTAAYDTAISRYLNGPIYHAMLNGFSLCEFPPGLPIDWPSGHRNISMESPLVTCPDCKAIAKYVSKHPDVTENRRRC